jgi:hypothetical protein
MRSPRQQRELLKELERGAPRERSFAQLFPWRNLARALLLVVVILAIVAIKKSAAPLLSRVGELVGAPTVAPSSPQAHPPR